VAEGVAEKLADDDARVVDDGLVDAGVDQLGAEAFTGDRDAGRCVWEQYDARRPHLPVDSRLGRDPSPLFRYVRNALSGATGNPTVSLRHLYNESPAIRSR
jgi:hypothetical protein